MEKGGIMKVSQMGDPIPENVSYSLCRDPLWVPDLMWNTANPVLTECLSETLPVLVPFLLLIVVFPFLPLLPSHQHPSNSILHRLRQLLILLLILSTLVELLLLITNSTAPPVLEVSSLVRLLSYCLASWLYHRLNPTSIPLFLYWLLAGSGSLIRLLASISRGSTDLGEQPSLVIEVPVILGLLIASFFTEPNLGSGEKEEWGHATSPELTAPAPSLLFFSWATPLTLQGWRTHLKAKDMWALLERNSYDKVVASWTKFWSRQEQKAPRVSLLRMLFKVFGPAYGWSAVLQLVYTFLQLATPQLVNLLIAFVSSSEPAWHGFVYCALLVLASTTNTLLYQHLCYVQDEVGLRLQTAVTAAVYKKSMRLSSKSRQSMTVGDATNLIAVDCQRFIDVTFFLNHIWASPLLIVLCLVQLWSILGPSSLAGFTVILVLVPIQWVITKKMKAVQGTLMQDKDKRIKLVDEILSGIKVLKLYAWETFFAEKVMGVRKEEFLSLKRRGLYDSIVSFLFTAVPYLVALASFTCYVLVDPSNVLDAQTAFVSMTIFNLLRLPVNFLPLLISFLVQCSVSYRRIENFLNAEERDPRAVGKEERENAVECRNASFSWAPKQVQPTLEQITFKVKRGGLVAVVGSVGSGKSSLLSALLGDMRREGGTANVAGSIAYVPQQAWIQNETVKNNILFGKPINSAMYRRVVQACALDSDFAMLPARDKTEIGERGINLSGGQKQRLSMARAVYSQADVFLLDDPLSAVDTHVGKHLFDQVIGPDGLLKHKTRVLVTHAVHFLPHADEILVMRGGKISERGSYKQLLERKGAFSEFLIEHLSESQSEEDKEVKEQLEEVYGKTTLRKKMRKGRSSEATSSSPSCLTVLAKKQQTSGSDVGDWAVDRSVIEGEGGRGDPGRKLIQAEEVETGGVKGAVYRYYLTSIGVWKSLFILLVFLAYEGCTVGSSLWLARWSDDASATQPEVRNVYLGVYGTLGLLLSAFLFAGIWVTYIGTLTAARMMHDSMLWRIVRAPMSFFDTTPLGRILNRFSKDIDIADNTLPDKIRGTQSKVVDILGALIIILSTMPIFVVVIAVAFVAYYFLMRFYVSTTRQTKRLQSVTMSPIYAHFSESMTGASTINAFSRGEDFVAENRRRIEANQRCYIASLFVGHWANTRLEMMGTMLVLAVALFTVTTRGSIEPGSIGLCLSYALNISSTLQVLTRNLSDIETNLVSVERISEYQDVIQEAPQRLPENKPLSHWPSNGVVTFEAYSTRYREGLDLVLRSVDLTIKSGEKVRIVRMTRASKFPPFNIEIYINLNNHIGRWGSWEGPGLASPPSPLLSFA